MGMTRENSLKINHLRKNFKSHLNDPLNTICCLLHMNSSCEHLDSLFCLHVSSKLKISSLLCCVVLIMYKLFLKRKIWYKYMRRCIRMGIQAVLRKTCFRFHVGLFKLLEGTDLIINYENLVVFNVMNKEPKKRNLSNYLNKFSC